MEFRQALRDQVLLKMNEWIGPTASPAYLKYTDNHLHDVDSATQMPYGIAYVRQVDMKTRAEIGTGYSLDSWLIQIYILDFDTVWVTGDNRMSDMVGRLRKRLQQNPKLGNFSLTDTEGQREYIYDSEVTSVTFDTSGQDGEYTFVSELFLTVQTEKG